MFGFGYIAGIITGVTIEAKCVEYIKTQEEL